METNMENNNSVPSVELIIDKPRRWQLDIDAYERVSDGFEELGIIEYVENPLESLRELSATGKDENQLKMTRRVNKILRVWIWAGLTGEDPELTLKELSRRLTVGRIPKLAIDIFPALTESVAGSPINATVGWEAEAVAAVASRSSA
jgi:hypothetical protein